MESYMIYQSPIGKLGIVANKHYLKRIIFENQLATFDFDNMEEKAQSLHEQVILELNEYFNGKRKMFSIPFQQEGTKFQQEVWHALTEIPYGVTCSYQDIARSIDNEKAVRAVGGANNRNQIPIIIPCHRVVGKNGALVGFGGGLNTKVTLLDLERKFK